MNWISYCLLIITGFISIVQKGCSLKCYVCNTDYDPLCGDPFDHLKVPLVDCSYYENRYYPQYCKKEKIEDNGYVRVVRTCAFDGAPNEIIREKNKCASGTGIYTDMEVCTCDMEGCNGSYRVTANYWFLFLPLLLRKIV